MRRSISALLVLAMVIASAFAFTGCAERILYGEWKMVQTGDPETGEFKDYDFLFPIVLEVRRDGTIYMMDSLFGTYEKKGHEFEFWFDEKGEKGELITGGWELIGSDLYIYPDKEAVIYKLSRLADATPAPAN